MTEEARRRDCDGVVCGHIHKAEIREINGMLYANDGDWVESLTALVEDFDGNLKIIHWNRRVEAPLNLQSLHQEMSQQPALFNELKSSRSSVCESSS